MQQFIERATCHNIHVWAMDGFRGYFSDWYGRWDYMQFIQSVADYNDSSLADQRFTGIIGDNEPNDGKNEPLSSFHNDIPDSGLDTTGGGVWQATQALDREYLMRDWVDMTKEAYDSCHAHNLLYAQLMVSWLDDYYGEAVHCTYNGQYKRVMEHMMNWVDDYFIMSY